MKNNDCSRAIRNVLVGLNYQAEHIDQALRVLSGEIDLTNKPLLNPKQLCRLLGISRTTLWRLDLPSMSVGKVKRYSIDAVITELEKRKRSNNNGEGHPVTYTEVKNDK